MQIINYLGDNLFESNKTQLFWSRRLSVINDILEYNLFKWRNIDFKAMIAKNVEVGSNAILIRV